MKEIKEVIQLLRRLKGSDTSPSAAKNERKDGNDAQKALERVPRKCSAELY
jgi:hypothetical protein